MGIDDLCAIAHGLDPLEDGCGLCTIGMDEALTRLEEVPEDLAQPSRERRLPESNRWKVPVAVAQPCDSQSSSSDDDDPSQHVAAASRLLPGEAVSPAERAEAFGG